MSSSGRDGEMSDFAATMAFVAFLRAEADSAEQKAQSYRRQVEHLTQTFAISNEIQRRYEMEPEELAPLDETGVPRYSGRKRGRKPKIRKRKLNPDRKKRQHTGYTLFMREKHPGVKAEHPNLPNKDIIAMVAKMWKDLGADDKLDWKQKAQSTHVVVAGDDDEEPQHPVQFMMQEPQEAGNDNNDDDDDIDNDEEGHNNVENDNEGEQHKKNRKHSENVDEEEPYEGSAPNNAERDDIVEEDEDVGPPARKKAGKYGFYPSAPPRKRFQKAYSNAQDDSGL